MPSLGSIATLLVLASLAIGNPVKSKSDGLLVKTELFTIQGVPWPNATDVRFFGGIPYAEPPVGPARFRPPITKSPVNSTIDASWFGPSCIQYDTGAKTVYTEKLPGFLLSPGQKQSEDCLTLNVWAPQVSEKTSSNLLPVMIWIHGGGFTGGGSASPYKYGHRLARDQNVIVVALNYRVNIFGFPNAKALDGRQLNPGLLDQRKAIEWVYQNIKAFGGNPEQMILFGQSAGGMSVDKQCYAYPDDPLVKGFIAQSGTAITGAVNDPQGTNFTYVATHVGCNSTDKDEEFTCMQKLDAQTIIQWYDKFNATASGVGSLTFNPTIDNETTFSNYTDRAARGLFAKLPTILAGVNNEGASLVAFNPAGPNQTVVNATTRGISGCPDAQFGALRHNLGVPVWRTRYFGEWPNLNPYSWLGAYHSSDIPMVFNTSDLLGPDTTTERATVAYIQGAWADFARDPENALDRLGWPRYDPAGKTLIKLGFENNTEAVFDSPAAYDVGC